MPLIDLQIIKQINCLQRVRRPYVLDLDSVDSMLARLPLSVRAGRQSVYPDKCISHQCHFWPTTVVPSHHERFRTFGQRLEAVTTIAVYRLPRAVCSPPRRQAGVPMAGGRSTCEDLGRNCHQFCNHVTDLHDPCHRYLCIVTTHGQRSNRSRRYISSHWNVNDQR